MYCKNVFLSDLIWGYLHIVLIVEDRFTCSGQLIADVQEAQTKIDITGLEELEKKLPTIMRAQLLC